MTAFEGRVVEVEGSRLLVVGNDEDAVEVCRAAEAAGVQFDGTRHVDAGMTVEVDDVGLS